MKLPQKIDPVEYGRVTEGEGPLTISRFDAGMAVIQLASDFNQLIDYLAEMERQQREVITRLTDVLLADRPINGERE